MKYIYKRIFAILITLFVLGSCVACNNTATNTNTTEGKNTPAAHTHKIENTSGTQSTATAEPTDNTENSSTANPTALSTATSDTQTESPSTENPTNADKTSTPNTETAKPTVKPTTQPDEGCVHDWSGWTVHKDAACEAPGEKSRVCKKCGQKDNATIAATNHIWDEGKTTVTPTSCSDMGVIKYTCKVCSKTKMEQITGVHTYGNWYYEDYTYTIDHGSLGIETIDSHRKVRSCTKCSFKEYANIAKHPCGLGYDTNKTTIIKQPVCDTPGIKRVQCTICGWYQDMDYTQAGVGHKLTEKKVHLSDYTQYTNELDATIVTCTVCGKQSVGYHYGKGYNDYYRWRVPVGIDPGTAYMGVPVNDNFDAVNHPTWQLVTRDHVYDAAGYVKQFTVYWHDKNGKRYSAIVKCGEGEIEALFASVGTYPSAKVTRWTLQISGTWLRPYMIHYQ